MTGKNIHPVQYVNEEDGCYYTFLDEDPEEDEQLVYQVQIVYGRGKPFQNSLVHTSTISRPAIGPSGQGMYPPPRFQDRQTGFCFVCGSPDHYANNCPYRGPRRGAPLPLPYQNCGEYGHGPTNCPRPQVARPVYKQIEVPPRE